MNFKNLRLKFHQIRTSIQPWRLVWFPLSFFLKKTQFKKSKRIKRILCIHFGGLGDALWMTPVWKALKEKYPDATIDVLVNKPFVKEGLAQHPWIRKVWLIQPLFRLESFQSNLNASQAVSKILWTYPFEFIQLWFQRYSLSIHFGLMFAHWESFGNAMAYALNIPRRIGYEGKESTLLTDVLRRDGNLTARELYLTSLAPLGIREISSQLYYPAEINLIPTALKAQLKEKNMPYAILHPGGTLHINSRRWSVDNFKAVAHHLLDKKWTILLTGSDEDAEPCSRLEAELSSDRVLNFCSQLNFQQTAAVVSLAKLCITNDTMMVHLADAVNVPHIFTIFGPTAGDLFTEKNGRYHVFQATLECIPCRKTVWHEDIPACPREIKQECLQLISPNRVIEEIDKLAFA